MMSMLLPGESLVQKKAFLLSAPAGGAPGAAQRACWLFFLAGIIRGQSRALAMLCILLLVMVGARVGGATLQLLQLLRLQSVMSLTEGCVPISICIFTVL